MDTHPTSGLSVICMPYLTRATLHHVSELLHTSVLPKRDARELHSLVARINAEDRSFDEKSKSLAPEFEGCCLGRLILKWGETLSGALHSAHQADILHCDVKPGNVLVLPDLSVQLLDFNLASSASDGARIIGGTMPYMASEQLQQIVGQFRGNHEDGSTESKAIPATDVFGLCATLWHLATGTPPFGVGVDSDSRTAAAHDLLERQMNGLVVYQELAKATGIPAEVLEAIAVGLSFQPDSRPASAEMLAASFRSLGHKLYSDLQPSKPGSSQPKIRPWKRKVFGLLGVVSLAIWLSVTGWLLPNSREPSWRAAAAPAIAASQFQKAEQLLEEAMDANPNDYSLAFELVLVKLRLRNFPGSGQLLESLAATRDEDGDFVEPGLRCLQYYLETVSATMLVEDNVGGFGSIGAAIDGAGIQVFQAHSPELEKIVVKWRDLSNQASLAGDQALASIATINAACVAIELLDTRLCGVLLDSLPAQDHSLPSVQRIRNTLSVLDDHQARKCPSSEALEMLRSTSLTKLTRAEALALVAGLAVYDIEQSDLQKTSVDTVSQRPFTNLMSAMTQLIPSHVEGGAFRYLLHNRQIRSNRDCLALVTKLVGQKPEPIKNRMDTVLLLPDSLIETQAGSSADNLVTGLWSK